MLVFRTILERIGVDCEHTGWTTEARISLLQLAVPTAVFVIDAAVLQGAACHDDP